MTLKIRRLDSGYFAYHPSDYIGAHLERYGEWAGAEVEFLKRHLSKDGVFIDIGAHIGTITVPLAKHLAESGLVLAVEPQRFVYQNLVTNIYINSLRNVRTFNWVVSDAPGWISLPDRHPSETENSGAFRVSGKIPRLSEPGTGRTRVATLDALVTDLERVDFLKIDVEGGEAAVLAGGGHCLDRYRPTILHECWSQSNLDEVSRILSPRGYRPFWLLSPNIPRQTPERGLSDINLLWGADGRSVEDLAPAANFSDIALLSPPTWSFLHEISARQHRTDITLPARAETPLPLSEQA